eukprot:m.75340 g.75340  ORF g.75340 m.75340 type:complete len:971 (+) comp18947_c0_seq1:169-3081(+)
MASQEATPVSKKSPGQSGAELDKTAVPVQLKIGLPVSAKYRGAWCEGKIIRRTEGLNCKVQFNSDTAIAQVKRSDIKGDVQLNNTVEAFHDESGNFRKATILKITDGSQYTVRFPDGDERTVRRNGVTLMGPTHFNEGTSLSDFPLTDPDAFGTPIPTSAQGVRKRRRIAEADASAADDATGAMDVEGATGSGGGSAVGSDSSTGGVPSPTAASRAAEHEEAPHPTGTHHEVVLVNPSREGLDTEQLWWPALVVPAAEVMREMIGANDVDHKFQFVVRFFEDNLYAIIEQQYIRTLQRGTHPFERFSETDRFLRQPAVARALEFLDDGTLPSGFRWKTYSEKCDVEAAAAAAWAEEHPSIAKTKSRWAPNAVLEANFLASLTRFMAKVGTPIKRTPSLGFKDLDLFRLYTTVASHGGHAAVSAGGEWRDVYGELLDLDDDDIPPAADRSLRSAYDKYLKQYEESLAEISRNGSANGMAAGDIALASAGGAGAAKEPSPRKPELQPASPFRFEVGKQARCAHTDGKFYAVTIEDRTVEDGDGGNNKRYKVHYLQWARRHDTWVDEDKLKDSEQPPTSGNGRRRARRRDPVADPSPSPLLMEGGMQPSPSDLLQMANSAKSLDGMGCMTDEELARTLALAEAAQSGRRRETRRSWNASLAEIQKQGEISTQIQGLQQIKGEPEEEAAVDDSAHPTPTAHVSEMESEEPAPPAAASPPAPKPEPVPDAEPEVKSAAVFDPASPQTDPAPESSVAQAEVKSEPEPEEPPELVSEAQSGSHPEPPPEIKSEPKAESKSRSKSKAPKRKRKRDTVAQRAAKAAAAAADAAAEVEAAAAAVAAAGAGSLQCFSPACGGASSSFSCYSVSCANVRDSQSGTSSAASMDTDPVATAESGPAEIPETVGANAVTSEITEEEEEEVQPAKFIKLLDEQNDKSLDEKLDLIKEQYSKHSHAVRVMQQQDRRAALERSRANNP